MELKPVIFSSIFDHRESRFKYTQETIDKAMSELKERLKTKEVFGRLIPYRVENCSHYTEFNPDDAAFKIMKVKRNEGGTYSITARVLTNKYPGKELLAVLIHNPESIHFGVTGTGELYYDDVVSNFKLKTIDVYAKKEE